MDALTKVHWTKSKTVRVAASAAMLSVMLGACSSVPDAINPVSWYEKTTDFFSGDSQAADTTGAVDAPAQSAENKGLSADPAAPPPAPAPSQQVASAPSGLSADQASGNYASPPIERQGAPSNVLSPTATAQAAPPTPAAAPQVAVTAEPAPMPAPMAQTSPKPMPQPMATAQTPPPPPSMPKISTAPAATPEQQYASAAPMSPPKPFEFPPASAPSPFANEAFETVVITADGMEAATAPMAQPQLAMASAPAQSAPTPAPSALFPEPGATTTGDAGPVAVGGMLRVATIHFGNNSSSLDQRDRSILGAVIQLQKERGGRVVVVGHASSRTKDMDYIKHQMVNFEISMQRAGTIGSALKRMGLSDEVLEVQAVSDTQPLFLEVMPSGEAGNRRVEIYLAGAAT